MAQDDGEGPMLHFMAAQQRAHVTCLYTNTCSSGNKQEKLDVHAQPCWKLVGGITQDTSLRSRKLADQGLPPQSTGMVHPNVQDIKGLGKKVSMAELNNKNELFRTWKGYSLPDRNLVTLARHLGMELGEVKLNCHLN